MTAADLDLDRSIGEFVGERWDALVRLATVLSGDPAEAAIVVRSAIVRVAARRHPDLAADVPGEVVRLQLRRWRRSRVPLDESPGPAITSYDASAAHNSRLAAEPPERMTAYERLLERPPRQRADLALARLEGAAADEDREFFDRAMGECPPPGAPPLAASMSGAVRRRRLLGRSAVAAGAVAGLAIATGAVVTATDRAHPPASHRAAGPAFVADLPAGHVAAWPAPKGGHAAGLAVGFGSAWDGSGDSIERRDLRTGRVRQRIDVGDALVVDVATCAGRVWGLATSIAGHGELVDLAPHGGGLSQAAIALEPLTLSGSACFAGSLWLPSSDGHVIRVTPGGHAFRVRELAVSGVPQSLAVGGGHLWVQRAAGWLAEIVPGRHGAAGRLGSSWPWNQPLLAAATEQADPNGYPLYIHFGVWTTDGTRLIGLVPQYLVAGDATAMVYRYLTSAPPLAVVSSDRGVFVATSAGVDFFDQSTLQSGYRPSAFYYRPSVGWAQDPSFRGHLGVGGLAIDGSGVLILDGDGSITAWTPPAPQARR